MTDETKPLVESELHVVASSELEEEVSADLLLPEGDIQLNSMFGEAMYFSPPVYTFEVNGPATESLTAQEGKVYNKNKFLTPHTQAFTIKEIPNGQ